MVMVTGSLTVLGHGSTQSLALSAAAPAPGRGPRGLESDRERSLPARPESLAGCTAMAQGSGD